ncbi:MAG TPA: YkgJ family cysteine cluster protein [Acidiferrobacterales bacterium]
MFYKTTPLRFHCTGCGACCTGGMDHCVEIGADEQAAIQAFLGLDRARFRRRYLERLGDDGGRGIRLKRDGRCPFLDEGKRCAIYPVRPKQCRTYPWWPELVGSERAWLKEAKRCEGIGRGRVVPLRRIEAELEASSK